MNHSNKSQLENPLTLQGLKRTSIANSLIIGKHDLGNKCYHVDEEPIDILQRIKKMAFEMKDYEFKTFDLKDIEKNKSLIKANRKFSTLLDTLKSYNKKLEEGRENDIVNYKFHQFYYSTIKICNNKTEMEVEEYLKEMGSWLNAYQQKREFVVHPNKKKINKKEEDEQVRQTFKSNMPLEINQYTRKLCALPLPKGHKDNKYYNDLMQDYSDDSDSESFAQNMNDSYEKDSKKKKNDEEVELPSLRAYRIETMKIKKLREEKEDQKMIENIKKNQSRIQTQSANNFYKPSKNKMDLFIKTQGVFDISKEAKNTSEELSQNNSNKENQMIIGNSTTVGFYKSNKEKLRRNLSRNEEFGHSTMYSGFGSLNLESHEEYEEFGVHNIEGLNLIKNPYDSQKIKRIKHK